jgi:hypothetical protein
MNDAQSNVFTEHFSGRDVLAEDGRAAAGVSLVSFTVGDRATHEHHDHSDAGEAIDGSPTLRPRPADGQGGEGASSVTPASLAAYDVLAARSGDVEKPFTNFGIRAPSSTWNALRSSLRSLEKLRASRLAWRLQPSVPIHRTETARSEGEIMTMQRWLDPDPDHGQVSVVDLVVQVRPASRVSRWAWHLIDRRDGSEFETGFEYDSPSDARWAAFSRLAELTASVPGAMTGVAELFSAFRPVVLSISAPRLRAA